MAPFRNNSTRVARGTIAQGDTYALTPTGGAGNSIAFSWAVSPTGQGVTVANGVVRATATAVEQMYTVTVTDTYSTQASAIVTVVERPALSPASATISAGDSYSGFTASRGVPVAGGYNWSVSPASADVSVSSTGVVTTTTAATAQVYTVKATDARGNAAAASLTVRAALTLAPADVSVARGTTYYGFMASGGVHPSPYTWALTPLNEGVTISTTGVVHATGTAVRQQYTVTVTDELANQATAMVTVP